MKFINKLSTGLISIAFLLFQEQAATAEKISEVNNQEKEIENKAKVIAVQILVSTFLGKDDNIGGGSGVIVLKKDREYYMITNEHVVKRKGGYKALLNNRLVYDLKPIEKNPELDIALFKFDSDGINAHQTPILGNSIINKETAYVFGFPGNDEEKVEEKGKFVNVQITRTDILTYDPIIPDAYLDTGMSGGPILNSKSELIGIHRQTGEKVTNPRNTKCREICEGVSIVTILEEFKILKPKPGETTKPPSTETAHSTERIFTDDLSPTNESESDLPKPSLVDLSPTNEPEPNLKKPVPGTW